MADDTLPVDTATDAVAASADGAVQAPSRKPQLLEISPQATREDTGFGTNPSNTVSLIQSQSVYNNAFDAQYDTSVGPGGPNFTGLYTGGDDGRVVPGGTPGVGANNDDSGTKQNTTQIVKSVSSTKITPTGNSLDQYSSYTYNLSWYILQPNVYKTLLESQTKTLNGFQLLMRSGGGPNTTAGTGPTATNPTSPTNISATVTGEGGRNQYFTNDYYMDNLELESLIMGPATRSAHNVTRLKFTVTEPNGITLINNLWQAVNTVYKDTNNKLPYSLAQFCMVIRFYGYDSNGNLVKGSGGTTDSKAVIEKFYPFNVTNITFRVMNKQVEYQVEGLAIMHNVGFGEKLGIVKEPIELSGTTVNQVLGGTSQGSNPVPPEDGRESTPAPQMGQGVLDAQNASQVKTASDFTDTRQPNLIGTNIPGVATNF